MTREAAHALLDSAKAGFYVHPTMIYRALLATGDIVHNWLHTETLH